jgi:N-acetyl-gamma-glutamyl-phosphate reductase
MYKAGIAGATGYTGYELTKLIHRHPALKVGWVTSESSAGKTMADIHAVMWDYSLITLAEAMERADEVDVVFLCLPHAASIEPVRRFSATGVRVVDLSADYRLKDPSVYTKWYGIEHTAPDLLDEFIYGLCEVNRSALQGADKIAVPGCYPTCVNLGLYPLAQAGWLEPHVIIDAKSGVSGAGRKAKLTYNFVEAHDNLTPYNVGYRHRHLAEMEQVLNEAAPGNQPFHFIFSPHLLPVNRGMLSTMYVSVAAGVSEADVRQVYAESYGDEPFIALLPPEQMASLRHSTHTNLCTISITPVDPEEPDGRNYVITTSIDNLLKGASGQALQCFNIAAGLDETLGLN